MHALNAKHEQLKLFTEPERRNQPEIQISILPVFEFLPMPGTAWLGTKRNTVLNIHLGDRVTEQRTEKGSQDLQLLFIPD